MTNYEHENKISDDEITSSLKVISTTRNCNECKIRNCKWGTCNCSQITANAALDLINRQNAEIERLKEETEEYPFKCKVGNNSEVHSKSIEDYDNLIGDISAEAIKEFSKRLKDVWFDNRYDSPSIDFDYFVDNLVEEMTEVTENDL